MFKKTLSVILSCLLLNVAASLAYARSQDDKQAIVAGVAAAFTLLLYLVIART